MRLFKNFKKGMKSDYYISNALQSEQDAVSTYEKFLMEPALQEFGDLAGILQRNMVDEHEHMEKLGVMIYTLNISATV